MYKKVDANLNFVDREKQIEKFWNDNDIFKKSMEHRKEGETYTFYDGPPTANGKPHIGHVETRTIKDMIPRYQTMKGKFVPRKAGWDTHGLPVELEVEKLLGLNGKEQIEEYGMEPFIKKCKESVWKYKGMWEDFSKTVGFWADMDNPYVTYHDDFIESEWKYIQKDKELCACICAAFCVSDKEIICNDTHICDYYTIYLLFFNLIHNLMPLSIHIILRKSMSAFSANNHVFFIFYILVNIFTLLIL